MDRNSTKSANSRAYITSLSARRAWIEIILFVNLRVLDGVALRKESVDRNLFSFPISFGSLGRSPQGERG